MRTITAPGSRRPVLRSSHALEQRRTLRDLCLLATVTVLSTAPYLGRVGFYSDDWAFLASLEQTRGESFWSAFDSMAQAHELDKRPLQNLAQLVLFRAFHHEPLGYQLALAAALVLVAFVAYLLLLEMRVPRHVAFAIPALFVLLPNYATVRFWFATVTYVWTFLAYLISTYGEARALSRPGQVRWRWKALAWSAALLAGFGIEFALPLLAANVVVAFVWGRREQPGGGRTPPRALILAAAGNVLVLAAVASFKVGTFGDGPAGSVPANARGIVRSASVQIVDFGIALPHTAWWAAGLLDPWDWVAVIGVIGVVVVRLGWLDRPPEDRPRRTSGRTWLLLTTVGAIFCVLAVSVFLVSNRSSLTGTGIANRVWTAASFGWAMAVTAIVGALASRFRAARTRCIAWSGAVATLCGASIVVTLGVSHFWIDSYQTQNRVLDALTASLPSLPSGTTVILDGVCAFDGPAPVYGEPWDLSGRLALSYADPSLQANVLTSHSTVENGRLVITTWGEPNTYTPGTRLVLYQYDDGTPGTVRTLADADSARLAVASSRTRSGCPVDDGGAGEVLLPFDRWLNGRQ